MRKLATTAMAIVMIIATYATAIDIPVSCYLGHQKINLRAGAEITDGLDVGMQVEGLTENNFWEQDCTWEDTYIGAYGDVVLDLGDRWHVDPVGGLQVAMDTEGQGFQGGPEAGLRFNLHDNVGVGILAQYRWYSGDSRSIYTDGVVWLAGARVRF